jgi:hypothetical protein
MPSRDNKDSEVLLRRVFDWFPSLFPLVWYVADSGTRRETRHFQEEIIQRIDWMIEGLVDCKRAIRNEAPQIQAPEMKYPPSE